jgi:hypothetical protein
MRIAQSFIKALLRTGRLTLELMFEVPAASTRRLRAPDAETAP